MKTIYKFFILVFVLSGFSSCNDVVQVKLDAGSKLYVIDAFIDNGRNNQSIRITNNTSYFNSAEPSPVTNANVIVTDLNTNKQYVFKYTDNGYYTYNIEPGDTLGYINHQYKLEVNIDGYAYSSICTQKRPAIMDTLLVEKHVGGFGFGAPTNNKDTLYTCILSAWDIVDPNTDYYRIKAYHNDTLFNMPSDLNICIDGTGGPIPLAESPLIPFSQPATLLGFRTFTKFSTCKAEIYSINRDAYFFFIQASQQINNGGLFATTPENVKTNILTPDGAPTKATGWFCVSSVVGMKISVQ